MPRSSSYYIIWLLAGMIVTGSTNSLLIKYQDMQCVENCGDPDHRNRVLYEQPILQTLQMFLGQMCCFLPSLCTWLSLAWRNPSLASPHSGSNEAVQLQGKLDSLLPRLCGRKLLLLWFPAACSLTGATLLHVGILYTPVSIYQMTRGALVLLVGIFSVIFLSRRLWLFQWTSLLIVMAGVSLVGYCASLIEDTKIGVILKTISHTITVSNSDPVGQPAVTMDLVGVFFILLAQVFIAARFVIEEKIMSCWSVRPLDVAAFEGLFGALTILFLMPFGAQHSVTSLFPYFDLTKGWYQMLNNPRVLWSGILVAFSISLYNYFCLSVTRHVSATARSLTDTCRTLSVWLVSLTLGWEQLLFPISFFQVLGFSIMMYGTCLFSNVVPIPKLLRPLPANDPPMTTVEEADAPLSHSTLDESTALLTDLSQSTLDARAADGHVRQAKD